MPQRLNRRRFLQTSAALGVAGVFPGALMAKNDKASANDKLHVGVIGVSGQGGWNVGQLAHVPGAEIVALCDVHEHRAADARKQFSDATFHTDFRKLIDQKGLDAVLIATPDHTHAIATMTALKAGLHVYCEKPLTHTVSECRAVREMAAKKKLVTQMGTQIHAGGNYRRVVEVIQSGAIGPVREAHVWVEKVWSGSGRPTDTPPVPDDLHWDLWLGPVEERPYNSAYLPEKWRGFWAFGGGTLADMACHHMDLPFWALNLRYPEKVSAEGSPVDPETTAKWTIVTYEFPARDKMPAVKLTWHDGGKRPKFFADGTLPKWGDGTLFVGEKGMLIANYDAYKLLPEKDFQGFTPPKKTITDSIGHHREWVEACKTGGTTTCNFDYSGALAETVLLGTVAYRLGKPFTWDGEKLKASEADVEQYIQHHYRKGWAL
jgi:predicted dehydrogenase